MCDDFTRLVWSTWLVSSTLTCPVKFTLFWLVWSSPLTWDVNSFLLDLCHSIFIFHLISADYAFEKTCLILVNTHWTIKCIITVYIWCIIRQCLTNVSSNIWHSLGMPWSQLTSVFSGLMMFCYHQNTLRKKGLFGFNKVFYKTDLLVRFVSVYIQYNLIIFLIDVISPKITFSPV